MPTSVKKSSCFRIISTTYLKITPLHIKSGIVALKPSTILSGGPGECVELRSPRSRWRRNTLIEVAGRSSLWPLASFHQLSCSREHHRFRVHTLAPTPVYAGCRRGGASPKFSIVHRSPCFRRKEKKKKKKPRGDILHSPTRLSLGLSFLGGRVLSSMEEVRTRLGFRSTMKSGRL